MTKRENNIVFHKQLNWLAQETVVEETSHTGKNHIETWSACLCHSGGQSHEAAVWNRSLEMATMLLGSWLTESLCVLINALVGLKITAEIFGILNIHSRQSRGFWPAYVTAKRKIVIFWNVPIVKNWPLLFCALWWSDTGKIPFLVALSSFLTGVSELVTQWSPAKSSPLGDQFLGGANRVPAPIRRFFHVN